MEVFFLIIPSLIVKLKKNLIKIICMKGGLIILLFTALSQTYAQGIFDDKLHTTRQHTLRGSITPRT